MNKNIVFIIIDALRFDVIQKNTKSSLTPTLNLLIDKGYLKKIITNGQVTKFVVPSIFTQTYPLDKDGYNYGIKNRDKSFVEILKENGFKCLMLEGHDIDGPFGNCERGFDEVHRFYDKRLLLEGFIKKKLLYDINKWRSGKYSKKKIIHIFQKELGDLLSYIQKNKNRVNQGLFEAFMGPYTKYEIMNIEKEKELLSNYPMEVIRKVELISPYFYFDYLGKKKYKISFKIRNKFFSIFKKIQNLTNSLLNIQISFIPSRPRIASQCRYFFNQAINLIKGIDHKWFMYIHFMDLHDHSIASRPIQFLSKFLNLPTVLKYRKKQSKENYQSLRSLSYDLSVFQVDKELSKFISKLKKINKFDSTVFVIFGDHGDGWDKKRDQDLRKNFGFRTFYEHINIPLIIYPKFKNKIEKGLHDSMSISASLLELLKINQHKSFKGISIFKKGKKLIVTENCGRGNADIKNRDIFFTLTNDKCKLMLRLKEEKLILENFYDLKQDPKEITNLINCIDKKKSVEINEMLSFFFQERKELLYIRNFKNIPNLKSKNVIIKTIYENKK